MLAKFERVEDEISCFSVAVFNMKQNERITGTSSQVVKGEFPETALFFLHCYLPKASPKSNPASLTSPI